mmetsp:Transcript_24693/g.18698  ORF Transcript_24693/g.18698 Transcript_24693/m.18698 type:complete len:134 (+) Transcript_24693:627-1028(+)
MFLILYGISFLLMKNSPAVIQTFFVYSIFLLTLSYSYEVFKLSFGQSLLLALGATCISGYVLRKPERVDFVAAIGVLIGFMLGLFLTSLFEVQKSLIVYPVLLGFCILGAAAFFKGDTFFCYVSTFVVALLVV